MKRSTGKGKTQDGGEVMAQALALPADPKLSKVPKAELMAEVTASIVEGRQFQAQGEVLRRVLKGELTPDEFDAAQVAGFNKLLPKALADFKAGTLFGQQGLDFLSWLMVTDKEIEQDRVLWDNVKACAGGVHELHAFAFSRILPTHADRQRFMDKGRLHLAMGVADRQALTARRTAFSKASLKWGWT